MKATAEFLKPNTKMISLVVSGGLASFSLLINVIIKKKLHSVKEVAKSLLVGLIKPDDYY